MIDKELIHQAAEDIDIFEADLTEEFEQLAKPHRTIRLWPLAVAACTAGIAFILLMPPRIDDGQQTTDNGQQTMVNGQWRVAGGLEAQLAHQQEIKEKGERLAAYVRKYTTNEMQ
ncbi:MAG: hypothetical protein IKQ07_05200 [Bacteroidaceae bacterium]|nr:hypothetical protein [Bacteroidaceae bacterium]